MTTPTSVRMLRSLCAQRLEAEMATASDKFIVVGRGIDPGDTNAPHPNIRGTDPQNYVPACFRVWTLSKQKRGSRSPGPLSRYRSGLRLESVGHREARGARELVGERLPVLRVLRHRPNAGRRVAVDKLLHVVATLKDLVRTRISEEALRCAAVRASQASWNQRGREKY